MKLIFRKEQGDTKVFLCDRENEDEEIGFDYIKMVEFLFLDKEVEDPIIEDGFTEEEKENIDKIIDGLRQTVIDADTGSQEEREADIESESIIDEMPFLF